MQIDFKKKSQNPHNLLKKLKLFSKMTYICFICV